MTDIAVIVVNYGTPDLAVAAVESVLARDHGGRTVEVHLVDNASPGDDARLFSDRHAERGWGERVTLWLEETNHGFGRGNNLVLEALSTRAPRYAFLLNPDATLENETLDILAAFLDTHPHVAFAGAGIAKPGSGPVTAAFRFPTPLGEFVRQASFGPIARAFADRIVPLPPDHPEARVDWVAGAAVMMRFDAIQTLEYFDPAYFLYYEEVDLMHRAARAGWETWFVPSARVLHAEGQATGVKSGRDDRPRKPDYWYDSWRIYFRSNYGPMGLRLAALAWMAGAAFNHVIGRLPGRQVTVPSRFFGDFGRGVLRPLVGLERSD